MWQSIVRKGQRKHQTKTIWWHGLTHPLPPYFIPQTLYSESLKSSWKMRIIRKLCMNLKFLINSFLNNIHFIWKWKPEPESDRCTRMKCSICWFTPKMSIGEFNVSLPHGWQGPNYLNPYLLPHRVYISRKLEWAVQTECKPRTKVWDTDIHSSVLTATKDMCPQDKTWILIPFSHELLEVP